MTGFICFETALKHPSASSGVLQLRIVFVRLQGDKDICKDDDDDKDNEEEEEEDSDEQNVLDTVLRRNCIDIA